MAQLINQTKRPVSYYAAGCTPESGIIPAEGSIEVDTAGPVIPWVEFGRQGGDGSSPVRVVDVPEKATVTLSVTVS